MAAAPSAALAYAVRVLQPNLLFRRLGYPSSDVWRHLHSAFVGITNPLPARDAAADSVLYPSIAYGRMRALPYARVKQAPAGLPLGKVFMDFAGPIVRSINDGFRYYVGIIARITKTLTLLLW